MNLTGIIESAEKQFKQILEDFFISVYNEKSLSSHGIDHHRRVWNYSKELLKLFPLKTPAKISQLPTELIIASYLHDIGISVDPGIRHGKHSKNLCIQFMSKNNLAQNDFRDVLDAIENHDDKNYTQNAYMDELLVILSVADDLDAFGFTGIFRYLEIYLTRGIEPDKIGYLIGENAKKRIDNFVKIFGADSEIVQKHIRRYHILDNFFSKYNEQLPAYQFGTKNLSGYCGVIEIFQFLLSTNQSLKTCLLEPEKYSQQPFILKFFADLEKEMNSIIIIS